MQRILHINSAKKFMHSCGGIFMQLGDGINLYVASVPYHIMLSCNRYCVGDVMICTEGLNMNNALELMIKSTFSDNLFFVESLEFYKKNLEKLIFFRKNMKKIKAKLDHKVVNNIVVFNDLDPAVQWIMHNIKFNGDVTVIEEGIGLYRDTVKRKKIFFKFGGKIFFGHDYENINRIGESAVVTEIICSHPSKLSNIQRSKNITHMEDIDYKEFAHKLGIDTIINRDCFIGQPLVEDGVISESEYCDIIVRLAEAKCAEEPLLLKPHPREDLSKYGRLESSQKIKVIKDNYQTPIELMIDTDQYINVYTIYSSAIINLSSLKNVCCYSLYCLYPYKNLINDEIVSMLSEADVKIPMNWNDLKRME